MYSPYGGGPPWMFMPPPPRRKRHYSSGPQSVDDLIETHKKWQDYLEDLKKKEKEKDKKPPKQSEVLLSFIGQLSVFIVLGFPLGLLWYKMMGALSSAVVTAIPVMVK